MVARRKAPRRRARKSFNVSAIELGTALSLSQSTGAATAIQTALKGDISGALMGMQEMGIAIPPEILIEKAPIPEKKDLIEAIQKQQQQIAESQQKQEQLQMAEIQAKINLANARALADEGLGVERISTSLTCCNALTTTPIPSCSMVSTAPVVSEVGIKSVSKLLP